jgi:hypothetical protein
MDPAFLVLGGGGVFVVWITWVIAKNRWTQDKAWFRRAPDLVVVASRLGMKSHEEEDSPVHPMLGNTLFGQRWSPCPTYVLEGRRGDLDVAVLECGFRRAGQPHKWRTAVVFKAARPRWPRYFVVPLGMGGDPTEVEGCKAFELREVGGDFEGEYSFHAGDDAAVSAMTSDVKRRLMESQKRGAPMLLECLGDRCLVHASSDSPTPDQLVDLVATAETWQALLADAPALPAPVSSPAPAAAASGGAPLAAKFCPQCGTPLGGPARFCPQCGKPLG